MNRPKIILWDLEILRDNKAITAEHWFGMSNFYGRTLKGDINSICSFGYKVLGSKKSTCVNVWDFPEWQKDINDDSALVAYAYEILKDADGIVTHNGKSFDLKLLNTRLIKYGFPPLPNIPHVDTKLVAKRHLSMFSNSLNSLAKYFNVETKMGTGSELWDRVMRHDPKAMKHMSDYCAQDVEVLEQVFTKLLAYTRNIPNYNLFNGQEDSRVCPNCGSTELYKHGKKVTKTKLLQRYQCQSCGTISTTDMKDRNPKV